MCSGAPRLARQQKVVRTRVRAGMWRPAASDGKVSGAAAGLSAAGGCWRLLRAASTQLKHRRCANQPETGSSGDFVMNFLFFLTFAFG